MSRPDPRAILAVLALLGCEQAMRDQPRIDPLEPASFFADGMGARDTPPGAVPRGHARADRHLWEGRRADGSLVAEFPFPITPADLLRGEQRYGIHCTPCHGRLGDGDGIVVRRGYPAPPPYTLPRLLTAPPGHLFDVITRGRAFMPDYDHLAVADRWRIVAWLRVLQLAGHAPVAALDASDRQRLAEATR